MANDRNDSGESAGRKDARRADFARRAAQLVVGRLQEHGRANYQFRRDLDPSYYVRLLTSRGERVLWGKDLERALSAAATRPKIGDMVGAQRVGRESVTVMDRRRNAEGRVISQREHHAHRTQWRLEKVQFFAERAKLARRLRDAQADVRESIRAHPELKSTFLTVRAAEEFAARRIADPRDRERFLDLVRGAVAGSIQRGEPLSEVRLRERPRATTAKKAEVERSREDTPTR